MGTALSEEGQVRLLLCLSDVFGIRDLNIVLMLTFFTTNRAREGFQIIALIFKERLPRQVKGSPEVAKGPVQAIKE